MGDKNSPMIRMGYIKNKLSTRMVEFTFREKYFKCCILRTKFLGRMFVLHHIEIYNIDIMDHNIRSQRHF